MNHFDVEEYAKELMHGYTLAPKEESWIVISEKLEEIKALKRRQQRVKALVAVCIVLLLFNVKLNPEGASSNIFKNRFESTKMVHFMKNDVVADTLYRENERLSDYTDVRGTINTMKDNPVNDSKKITRILLKNEQVQNEILWEKFQRSAKHLNENNDHLIKNTNTKSETDSLLFIAQQHLQQQEQLILMENRKSLAYEILEDLNKEEVAEKESSFIKNVKHGYSKFKRIISN